MASSQFFVRDATDTISPQMESEDLFGAGNGVKSKNTVQDSPDMFATAYAEFNQNQDQEERDMNQAVIVTQRHPTSNQIVFIQTDGGDPNSIASEADNAAKLQNVKEIQKETGAKMSVKTTRGTDIVDHDISDEDDEDKNDKTYVPESSEDEEEKQPPAAKKLKTSAEPMDPYKLAIHVIYKLFGCPDDLAGQPCKVFYGNIFAI